MNKTIDAKIHNRFDIEVRDAKTGKLKQQAYAENIILDGMWARLLRIVSDSYNNADRGWFQNIYFGTGTGTISASRTSLFNQLGVKTPNTPVYSLNTDINTYCSRRSISLLENEYNGSVLTEVGVGDSVLCTHALLKDMNGNQISLTKVDTDIIIIYASVYLKFSTPWANFPSPIGPDIAGPDNANFLLQWLLGYIQCGTPIYTWPSMCDYYKGDYLNYSSYPDYRITQVAFTPTVDVVNKLVTNYVRLPAANGNDVGGIKRFHMYNGGYGMNCKGGFVGTFSGAQHSQGTITEQIGTGDGSLVDFQTTFGYVKPGAIIKVDGVQVSATVKTGIPKDVDFRAHLRHLGMAAAFSGLGVGGVRVFENPFWELYGVDTYYPFRCRVETSDDMITWTIAETVYYAGTARSVPVAHKNKRYWRITDVEYGEGAMNSFNNSAFATNVHLDTAPATGAVITAEYETDCAAKDVNHVLDLTVTMQFGEYTP